MLMIDHGRFSIRAVAESPDTRRFRACLNTHSADPFPLDLARLNISAHLNDTLRRAHAAHPIVALRMLYSPLLLNEEDETVLDSSLVLESRVLPLSCTARSDVVS